MKKSNLIAKFLVCLAVGFSMIVIAVINEESLKTVSTLSGIIAYIFFGFALYFLWMMLSTYNRKLIDSDKKYSVSKRTLAAVLAIFACGFLLFWFAIRPSNIKKECHAQAMNKATYNGAISTDLNTKNSVVYMSAFEACKNSNGL